MRGLVAVLITISCVSCETSPGPSSAWTYEVPGNVDLASAALPTHRSYPAVLLVTVSPFDESMDHDNGVPQTIAWTDGCAIDVLVQDQHVAVPDACGYLYQVLVSRSGSVTSSTLPACALPPDLPATDLPIQTSSLTFAPDSQAFDLEVTGGGIVYSFSSQASIPPPPAPGSAPCQTPSCVASGS